MNDAEFRKLRKALVKLYRRNADMLRESYVAHMKALHTVWHLVNGDEARGFLCRGERHR